MKLSASHVLLVEDDAKMPEVLAALLQDDGIILTCAKDVPEALVLVRKNQFDLVLLDLGLPGLNGFELLRQLKDSPEARAIPVVVLTALNSTADKLRGFELGAVDYQTKPFEPEELRARVCAALRTKHLQDELTQANRELLAARVAAEAAVRAKTEVLDKLGLKLRAPVSSLTAMAALLLKTPLNREQQTYVKTIHSSSESLLAILNDILDVSKLESAKLNLPSLRPDLRLLVVDDNRVSQKVALRLLEQLGHHADLAANGAEALKALDRQRYDLIFMDVMMPEMDGLKATRIIRERQQQRAQFPNYQFPITIVAMTARTMPEDREKCLAAGMDDYVPKPVRLEKLRAIIERWGTVAARRAGQAAAGASSQGAVGNGTPQPDAPAAQPPKEALVDLERLVEFTDGSPDNLRELVALYLKETGNQLEQLESAVRSGARAEARRLAHSCAGASATCGMRRLAPLLRELERQSTEGELASASRLCQEASREFERIRKFLEEYLAKQTDLVSKP